MREHIDIAKLVLRLAEVVHLDPALVDQGFQAIVQPAGAQTQALRNFALGHVGVVLQQAQHPKVSVFLQLRAAAGHGWVLARYRRAVSSMDKHRVGSFVRIRIIL